MRVCRLVPKARQIVVTFAILVLSASARAESP
jgi:hypothetical protein